MSHSPLHGLGRIQRHAPRVARHVLAQGNFARSIALLGVTMLVLTNAARAADLPVLTSGHHANIAAWRREQMLKTTWERRPDLLGRVALTAEDRDEPVQQVLFHELTPEEHLLTDQLKRGEKIHIDQLSSTLEMPTAKVSSVLLGLEFKGVVETLPGNLYRLR